MFTFSLGDITEDTPREPVIREVEKDIFFPCPICDGYHPVIELEYTNRWERLCDGCGADMETVRKELL